MFLGGIDPKLDGLLGVFEGLFICQAVSETAGQFRYFSDIDIVLVAPVYDYSIFSHRQRFYSIWPLFIKEIKVDLGFVLGLWIMGR